MEDSGRTVCFPSENSEGECSGVMYGDSSLTPRGLIVLHAWWGLNPEIQKQAQQMAEEGNLVTMVPDLYRGKVAKDRETAGHYMADLDWEGAVKDVEAAARFLKNIGCSKVGVTGFCMGGALTFLAALKVEEISAASPFYGIPKPHLGDLTQITIPVRSHFGENDDVKGLSSPDDYYPLEYKLKKSGVDYRMYVYDGAGHGFAHPSYAAYDPVATREAFNKLYAFMREQLT